MKIFKCIPPKRRPLSLRVQITIWFQVNFFLEDCSQMQEVIMNPVLGLIRLNLTLSLFISMPFQRVVSSPSGLWDSRQYSGLFLILVNTEFFSFSLIKASKRVGRAIVPGTGANIHTLHKCQLCKGQQWQEAGGRLHIYSTYLVLTP